MPISILRIMALIFTSLKAYFAHKKITVYSFVTAKTADVINYFMTRTCCCFSFLLLKRRMSFPNSFIAIYDVVKPFIWN